MNIVVSLSIQPSLNCSLTAPYLPFPPRDHLPPTTIHTHPPPSTIHTHPNSPSPSFPPYTTHLPFHHKSQSGKLAAAVADEHAVKRLWKHPLQAQRLEASEGSPCVVVVCLMMVWKCRFGDDMSDSCGDGGGVIKMVV